jgi:hypothetical protein
MINAYYGFNTANPPPAVPMAVRPFTEYINPASLSAENPSSTLSSRPDDVSSSASAVSDRAIEPNVKPFGIVGLGDRCMN